MNLNNFFSSLSLILIITSFASSAPEFIKISKMQKDSVIARKQKEKKAMEQRLQEIQRLKKENEQAINALDIDIKEAKYEIISLEREFDEYSENPEMQRKITSESDEFKANKQRYEDNRKHLQNNNEALSKESNKINNKLNALR